MAVVFAFGGLEVVTIAAADAEDPREAIGKAVRTVHHPAAGVLPGFDGRRRDAAAVATTPKSGTSPYVAVLDRLGIPGAAQIMNVVVFVALLSSLNANLYGTARMLYSLAERDEAPKALLHKQNGVPRRAVLASVTFGFLSVLLNYLWPDTVFLLLLNAAGSALLVVWAFIAVSQLRMRPTIKSPAVPMWGFPYLTWLALAGIGAIIVLMLTDEASPRPDPGHGRPRRGHRDHCTSAGQPRAGEVSAVEPDAVTESSTTRRRNLAPLIDAVSVTASSCHVRRPLSATLAPSAQISKIAVPSLVHVPLVVDADVRR